ncbi:putative phage tail protein [Lactiplantibacillus plajomi]|uniref:Phage tail protein n=1 Tax=Lactiplantibacillus plajomi TaxID=1457217 RepID=A0ABV6K0V8_9LACO|nr:putative phage tail protein [Lactiplantibacillus plajomi]
MVKLADYLPDYYDNVLETDLLMQTEQKLFDGRTDELGRLLMNQFVTQADSTGLSVFEAELGMDVDPHTPLETRRTNILLRVLPPQAITLGYFRQLVNALKIPADIVVDSVSCVVKTLSTVGALTPSQVVQLKFLMNTYLPSNLAYQISKQGNTDSKHVLKVGFATHAKVTAFVGATPIDYKGVG